MPNSKAAAKPAAPRGAARIKAATATRIGVVHANITGLAVARHGVTLVDGARLYGLDPQARIGLIRQGIPASMIGNLSSRMGMSKENLLSSLGLSRATISRKEKDATVLSKDESERVLGVETLIGMVQTMVEQSGDPTGFDAARWVSEWLTKPLPALAGETPASYMDTFEGQKLVAELLSMSQSGAYA
jgi:putative toxin-antitoxin system antitoxin component (TIGR02293 family)